MIGRGECLAGSYAFLCEAGKSAFMVTVRTTQVQSCVDRLRQGDESARAELIEAACARLRALAHKLLHNNRLRRWEETDDVMQQSLVRLHVALSAVQPESARHFLHLAACQMRRVLIDLGRHYFRDWGPAANHESQLSGVTHVTSGDPTPSQIVEEAERYERLHAEVEALPEDERDVVELRWFHGLTESEVAEIVGASTRAVQRRWVRARLKLAQKLDEALPGISEA